MIYIKVKKIGPWFSKRYIIDVIEEDDNDPSDFFCSQFAYEKNDCIHDLVRNINKGLEYVTHERKYFQNLLEKKPNKSIDEKE